MSDPFAGWEDAHNGRAFSGHETEDLCPCPQQPCGLVRIRDAAPECLHHPVGRAKTIRQSHRPQDCPELERQSALERKTG